MTQTQEEEEDFFLTHASRATVELTESDPALPSPPPLALYTPSLIPLRGLRFFRPLHVHLFMQIDVVEQGEIRRKEKLRAGADELVCGKVDK